MFEYLRGKRTRRAAIGRTELAADAAAATNKKPK
jgi:hypothetical protein